MRVAVCDNDKNDLAAVSELLQKYSGMHPEYSIETSAFSSAMEMLCHAERRGCCDLFLLDIYMDGIDGVAAAKEIRELTKDSEIIFITASKDFALDAFALDAAQYIVKPCTESTLFTAWTKFLPASPQLRNPPSRSKPRRATRVSAPPKSYIQKPPETTIRKYTF